MLPKRLDETLRLTALARELGDSASRLSHLIIEHLGIPFRPYVLWLRLQRLADERRGSERERPRGRHDELGIAASAVAGATVLAPTEVDLEYKFALDGDGRELELSVLQDLLDLLQLSQRRGSARAALDAARARAVAATGELVAEVEIAHIDLVAATQEAERRQTAFDAATASAGIPERMHAAGFSSTPWG